MNYNYKNCEKSTLQTYSNATQELTTTFSSLMLGNSLESSGVSMFFLPILATLKKRGLYRISADLTLTSSEAGVATVQALVKHSIREETIREASLPTSGKTSIHLETIVCIAQCGVPAGVEIQAKVDDTAKASVTALSLNIEKLA